MAKIYLLPADKGDFIWIRYGMDSTQQKGMCQKVIFDTV